jgi:hypothetical protein
MPRISERFLPKPNDGWGPAATSLVKSLLGTTITGEDKSLEQVCACLFV